MPSNRSTTSPCSSLISVTGIVDTSYSATTSGLSAISIAVYSAPIPSSPRVNISHIGQGGDERLIIVSDFVCFVVISSVLPFRLSILRRLLSPSTCAERRYLSHYLRHRARKSASYLSHAPLCLARLNRRLL